MYPMLLTLLIIPTTASKVCSSSECVSLTLCPSLQEVFANPLLSQVDNLKKAICQSTDDLLVCCENPTNTYVLSTKISRKEQCGYQDSVYEFPWMASFVAFGWSVCSGVLINERYVLTAASCASHSFLGDSLVKILLGDFNLKNTTTNCSDISHSVKDECAHFEKFKIEKSVPHPLFNGTFNNIGLIRLNRNVEFTDYIRPICLPSYDHIYSQPGDELKTSGFIINYDPILKLNRFKKNVTTRLLPLERCRSWLKEKGRSKPLTLYNVCSEDVPTVPEFINYFVDHGGPIMKTYNNQWFVEAILALSYDDIDKHRPNVNTNISYYLEWIYSTMESWE